eukprot:5203250-Pleurochrysis_carterae.AAC.2
MAAAVMAAEATGTAVEADLMAAAEKEVGSTEREVATTVAAVRVDTRGAVPERGTPEVHQAV